MTIWFRVVAMVSAVALWAVPAMAEGKPLQDHTEHWNTLWHHVILDMTAIAVVFAAITIWFLVKYKRTSEDQEGDSPSLSFGASMAWAIIPIFLFLADDFYLAANGWKLWNDQRQVPENAMEVKVTASMWSWEYEYENGKTSEDLVVPVGAPVVVRGSSDDVVHGMSLADFRIKEDIMPGRITYLWFYPKEVGEHVWTCTEYCGLNHSDMYNKVVVKSKADFDSWLGTKG